MEKGKGGGGGGGGWSSISGVNLHWGSETLTYRKPKTQKRDQSSDSPILWKLKTVLSKRIIDLSWVKEFYKAILRWQKKKKTIMNDKITSLTKLGSRRGPTAANMKQQQISNTNIQSNNISHRIYSTFNYCGHRDTEQVVTNDYFCLLLHLISVAATMTQVLTIDRFDLFFNLISSRSTISIVILYWHVHT